MRSTRALAPILTCLLALGPGCGANLLAPDGGEAPDAGSGSDAGPGVPDSGAPDAGGAPADAGGADAGVDAGPVDAGPFDAGPPAMSFVRDPRDGGRATVTTVHWGDRYWPIATGFPPGADVLVTARADVVNNEYVAWGRFTASPIGTVDLATQAPAAGTWTGADFEGHVWSARAVTADPNRLPFNVLEVTFETAADAGPAVRGRLDRYYLDPLVVKTVPPAPVGIVAELYTPPNAVNRPAVIVFGGSEGGIGSGRFDAYYLASIGYPALAIAYFGMPGVPATLSNIELETWDRAYQWLATLPQVDAKRVAVMGGSRGGEAALALGASFPWVRGVIAQVPSGVSWAGDRLGLFEQPSWRLAGAAVPFIPSPATFNGVVRYDTDGIAMISYRRAFLDAIATTPNEAYEAAQFRIENARGRVLILAGGDDQLWPSCELGQIAWDRLSPWHRAQYGDEFHCVPGAGHAIPTPGSPTSGLHRASSSGQTLALGGSPAATARSARLADERIRALLEAL